MEKSENGTNPKSRIKFGENLHFFFDSDRMVLHEIFYVEFWKANDIMNMDQNDIYGNWESGLNFSKYDNASTSSKRK